MVRPNQFRFEYSEKGKIASGCVVWKSGQEVKVSMAGPPEYNKSLDMALAFATGISDGTAHTIPALLMPSEVTGTKLTDIQKPVRGEDKSIDGRNCFSIQGQLPGGRSTIWIDQESFLVRRFEQSYPFGEGVTVAQRTDYQPVINQDVAAKLLEYNPPK
jgi:outer membrane lipoprotein-sorting protein